jgi:acetoin utilization deacetylase AcuC-like enzyme
MDDEERVALVFEDAPLHQSSRFLERPQRVTAIEQALQEAGLLEACSLLENEEIVLTNEDLQHVHLPAYLTRYGFRGVISSSETRWCGMSHTCFL